jgi:hypothetical protein
MTKYAELQKCKVNWTFEKSIDVIPHLSKTKETNYMIISKGRETIG